ncbi:uncharacterized protein LOC134288281 [Aedes albopictus]|uniref:CCHC-type domain-containing protein n=1 Tax=Aedes albopictus TaxID=7160 RepID=A0ABM2A1A3_AEDAL
MTDDLRGLLKREKRIRDSLDSVASFVREFKEEEDKDEVEVRLQLLESAFHDFHEVREKIDVILDEADEDEVVDTEESEQDRQARLKYTAKKREAESAVVSRSVENCYCKANAALLKWQNQMRPANPSSAVPAAQPVLSRVKLPEIKLPSFSGVLRDWVSYRDAFQSLIHRNRELTDMDKFTYLRSSLSGDALLEVSSIELSTANYSVAWDALEDRYHNRKLIVKAYLDAIFQIESMRRESYEALSQLISDFEKNLQMLKKMNQDTDSWSTILVHMVCSRLDSATLRFWEAAHNSKEVPTYRNLITFLKNHCAVLQSVEVRNPAGEMKKPTISVSHPSTGSTGRCCFCSESFHPAFLCGRFQKMTIPERYDAVRKNGLCMNCLSSGHLARSCSKGLCRQCGRKHHTLLHSEANSAKISSVPQTSTKPPSQSQAQAQPGTPTHQTASTTHHQYEPSTSLSIIHTHSQNPQLATDQQPTLENTVSLPSQIRPSSRQVLLSTAIVRIRDADGSTMLARALLDSCSQYCFVTSEFCRRMNLKEFPNHLTVNGIGGSASVSQRCVTGTVSPRFASISNFEEAIRFNVLPKLTIPLPRDGFDVSRWNLPDRIVLADPEFYQTSDIDMIIGAEYYLDLLQEGRFRLSEDGPTFQNTVFGWIVSGRISEATASVPVTTTTLCCTAESQDRGPLPRKQSIIAQLRDSRKSAERRFTNLERRFATSPQMKKQHLRPLESISIPRWVGFAKDSVSTECLQEYENALLQLVRLSQEACFPQEIASLSREDQVKDSTKILALHPKLREGVLRVGGRLRNAPVSEDRKHPMIIDHRHPLASMIIQHYHLKMLHSGQQVLHECVTCFRMRPRCQEQLMPPERVNPAPPLLKVGVDYCDPFQVRKKRTMLYLSDLHIRTKWTRQQRDNIVVGTMVLLIDERLPSLKWNLGRVTEVFRGSDGNIRVVEVQISTGVFRRLILKTCMIPIRDNLESSNEPVVLRHPRRSLVASALQ